MTPRPLLILSLLCLPTLGCDRNDDDPQARIDTLVHENVTELTEQVRIVCDCWEDIGYASRPSCENDFFAPGPSQTRCIEDAYAQDQQTAIEFLECIVPLEREYTTCVNARLECSDFNSGDPCFDDYDVGLDTCIGLPPAITRDLDACFD